MLLPLLQDTLLHIHYVNSVEEPTICLEKIIGVEALWFAAALTIEGNGNDILFFFPII